MGKSDSLQGSLDLLIMKILANRAPLHGYAIISGIAELSGDALQVEEGSIYPALHRLEEGGWIKARWVNKDNGRRSRRYELTAAGRKRLPLEETRWTTVSSAIHQFLKLA